MKQRNQKQAYPSVLTIEQSDRAELVAWYRAYIGELPNPRASIVFIRSNLIWAVQALSQGHEPDKIRQRVVRQLGVVLKGNTREHSGSRAGTRLVREWHGKVHEVIVLEKGYQWQGRTYRSLSAIAGAITGSQWSGPRFFGLKET